MRFTVVVPTYNRANLLARTLAALSSQTHRDYEVIVVDDGSKDETASVTQQFPAVRYVRQSNRGPAAARNLGIGNATGEVVAFTDDDCIVPLDWLEQLESGYVRHSEVIGVGGYQEASEDVLTSNIFAQYEQNVSLSIYGVGSQEIVGGFECPAGGTNNMSYLKCVLDQVGGFDESFPSAAGEDADLKWRICQKGFLVLYIPVKATHLQPYNWESFKRQNFTRGKGAFRFEEKWASRPSTSRIIARLGWRFTLFCRDFVTMESKRIAAVKLIGGVYDCLGQLQQKSRGRSN